MKIRLVGAKLFNADGQMAGQTDRQTGRYEVANGRFSEFFFLFLKKKT
jgi:hypothetical protein